MLSESDHQRIAAAIERVEQNTDGEIFCVLAREISHYREVPLAWAAVGALLLPWALVLAGLRPLARADIFSSWSDESLHAAMSVILRALSAYAILQAGLFAAIALVVSVPAIRRAVTPAFLKRHRVRQVARHHFVASGYRLGDATPHVLIYASMLDRQVEIVAHKAIHDAVGEKPWNEAATAVVRGMKSGDKAGGFVRAVEICGDALARHFPATGPAKNRLPTEILET